MKRALAGETYADFDNVLDELSIAETLRTAPLLEIYTPLHSPETGAVIGVAEFYADGTALRALLVKTKRQGLLIVGSVALAMLAAIYLVVFRGAETIARQRQALDEKLHELSGLLTENQRLARRVKKANLKLAELNENALRRISADLHDGPLQLLSFAGMRLESVDPAKGSPDLAPIKQTVDDAMREIRQICRGLSLPEISEWNLATVVHTAIENHEKRTGIGVAREVAAELPPLPLAGKTTVYRFIQETLNNGLHHGLCSAQSVTVGLDESQLKVAVSDDGIGFDPAVKTNGLGLAGLKERINSLGGDFSLKTAKGTGTSVVMLLPMEFAKDAA
jgi:signal transduction histidine kinase